MVSPSHRGVATGPDSTVWVSDTAMNDLAGGFNAARALLSLSPPPSAIYAASDKLVLGVLRGATTCGVRVSQDPSAVGFDDIPMATYATPPLTTVRQPLEQMAKLAVQTALKLVSDQLSTWRGGSWRQCSLNANPARRLLALSGHATALRSVGPRFRPDHNHARQLTAKDGCTQNA